MNMNPIFSQASNSIIFTSHGYKIFPLYPNKKIVKKNCCPCTKNNNINSNIPPTQLEVLTKPKNISDFITKYESSPPNTGLKAYNNLRYFNSFEQLLEYQRNNN